MPLATHSPKPSVEETFTSRNAGRTIMPNTREENAILKRSAEVASVPVLLLLFRHAHPFLPSISVIPSCDSVSYVTLATIGDKEGIRFIDILTV